MSYSAADRPLARKVAEIFRARGCRVWIDEGELAPGDPLASSIAKALGEVDAYVAILTRNSANSKWVKSELNRAFTRMVEDDISVIPLRFDDSPVPDIVAGHIWGDARTEEGLIRALNRAWAQSGVTIPMDAAQVSERHAQRSLLRFGIRLVPTSSIKTTGPSLGPTERKYVMIGDYAEQCGRSLRQIQANLWFGDAFDRISTANVEWSALIFEIGETQRKKLDMLPGTWKAVFRILASPRRLAMIKATADEKNQLGPRPHDYYAGDQVYWYNRIMDRRPSGIGPLKISPESVLEDQLGIYDLCFQGAGITELSAADSTAVPSRVFFVKNTPLEALNVREQALGQPNDGVLLV